MACSADSEPSAKRAPEPGRVVESAFAGTLIHTEEFGSSIKVQFYKTETGAAAVVTGSIDEDRELSNQVNQALEKESILEAYRSLPGALADVPREIETLQADLDALRPARERFSKEEFEAFDRAQANPEPTDALSNAEAPLDHVPVRDAEPGIRTLAATPAGWNWASDYQWFRETFCIASQDCRVGYTWLYSGGKSDHQYDTIYGLNNSFEGTAEFGSRVGRWMVCKDRAGADCSFWGWTQDLKVELQPRHWQGIIRYGDVGPLLRDGWVSGYEVDSSDWRMSQPTFTTRPLGTDPRTSLSRRWVNFDPRGQASTTAGYYASRCVRDVPYAFLTLPQGPTAKIQYYAEANTRLPPYNAQLPLWKNLTSAGHLQGIERLQGVGDNRWVAVSGSFDGDQPAGVFFVHMGDLGGQTGYLFGPQPGTPQRNIRGTKTFYPINDAAHPGGMQAHGHVLAIAVEADAGTSFVEFIDVSDPYQPRRIQRFYVRTDSAPVRPGRVIGGAGLTRMGSGLYLLFVLGQDTANQGWFYLSDRTSITADTKWNYIGYTAIPTAQNAQFITECNTGNLYMLATDNPNYGADPNRYGNYAYLRRVKYDPMNMTLARVDPSDPTAFDLVFDSGSSDFCTFRAGVSPYASPSGGLYLYCHTRHAGGSNENLKIAEFGW
ncbi:MAG TPA: hypothetical protein VFZ53_32240 [Polyangiaceae bacterium]